MTETTTVRYTTFRYTGWRRVIRRLTFRPLEGPTYEFEAEMVPAKPFLPGLQDENTDTTSFSYDLKPVGPIRKIEP